MVGVAAVTVGGLPQRAVVVGLVVEVDKVFPQLVGEFFADRGLARAAVAEEDDIHTPDSIGGQDEAMEHDPAQEHLERLQRSRSLPRPDLSLGFLAEQFKREVAKPYKQLGDLAALWAELVPAELVRCSRLVGLSRGVLHVEVDHAAAHFEIDRLLRGGLQKRLIQSHKGGALRKVVDRLGEALAELAEDGGLGGEEIFVEVVGAGAARAEGEGPAEEGGFGDLAGEVVFGFARGHAGILPE